MVASTLTLAAASGVIAPMGDKATCPGCDAYTSGVLQAIVDGTACPYCGLPAHVIQQVSGVRRRRADEHLKEELSAALIRAGRAEAELGAAKRKLASIRLTLSETEEP